MEEQILAGLERGLEYMCFTDHYDPEFPYDALPDMEAGTFDLDHASYREEFLEMKERYSGRIQLYYGVELVGGDVLRIVEVVESDSEHLRIANHRDGGRVVAVRLHMDGFRTSHTMPEGVHRSSMVN